ncbi:AAA family ATPase [Spirosoma spitsbergense]|uniref:AAA family ATPase n=1 Tax=Spirosoma spitsbergense TaxID=431554 RepID=UPI00036304C8|nr:AAA family ATPase [Spirosoma spitsbergense]
MENNAPNTNNFLNWVDIKNFKSIKDLHLDCKRVNVFIGKPNVGKSNILEGLGLLGVDYKGRNFFNDFIRYKEIRELFYDSNTAFDIQINTDNNLLLIRSRDIANHTRFDCLSGPQSFVSTLENEIKTVYDFSNFDQIQEKIAPLFGGKPSGKNIAYSYSIVDSIGKQLWGIFSPNEIKTKKYDYSEGEYNSLYFNGYLMPPTGSNLFYMVEQNRELRKEIGSLFEAHGLDFVISTQKKEFEIQRRDDGYVFNYPYYTIADTFRRFIFYITAIESNKNSVIIFEEPEVHSFPPYTQDVAYRMIYSEENQFFVSTHSPYLLQTLVSNLPDDQLNVFVTYYENYETKAKALTPEELSFVQEYSTDVFFNLDRFVPNAQSANPA